MLSIQSVLMVLAGTDIFSNFVHQSSLSTSAKSGNSIDMEQAKKANKLFQPRVLNLSSVAPGFMGSESRSRHKMYL